MLQFDFGNYLSSLLIVLLLSVQKAESASSRQPPGFAWKNGSNSVFRSRAICKSQQEATVSTEREKWLHSSNEYKKSRRRHFVDFSLVVLGVSSGFVGSKCEAWGPFQGKDRRQLEVCLVNVMRVASWAQILSQEIMDSEDDDNVRKAKYLEGRLGAKACLTNKGSGGASIRVYTLASLQLTGCLEDLEYYSRPKSRKVDDLRRDLIEALGSIVEFDGLESVTDPSPRSSLTLQQYNKDKAIFVQRMLRERVVPLANELLSCYDESAISTAKSYMRQYYSSELPKESVATDTQQTGQ